jgi:hypothetical protein
MTPSLTANMSEGVLLFLAMTTTPSLTADMSGGFYILVIYI